MANSLEYAKKFLPIIDDIYKAQSLTEGMDAATQADFTGTNEVKYLPQDWEITAAPTAIPKGISPLPGRP